MPDIKRVVNGSGSKFILQKSFKIQTWYIAKVVDKFMVFTFRPNKHLKRDFKRRIKEPHPRGRYEICWENKFIPYDNIQIEEVGDFLLYIEILLSNMVKVGAFYW